MITNNIFEVLLISSLVIIILIVIRYYYPKFSGSKNKVSSKDRYNWVAILEKEFPYYNKLPKKSKEIFLQKVNYFYKENFFIPKRGFKIDDRKQMLICAFAAQLTFGLPFLKLSHFESILIFDRSKYIKGLEQWTFSDTQKKEGRINFSWEDIQHGLENPTDGYNVVLHKLAEAMLYENRKQNEEFNFIDDKYLEELRQMYHNEKKALKSDTHPFLNKIAGQSFDDFFAVTVENYFERPVLLKEQMPILYNIMCKVLNQDTALLEEA